MLKEYYGKKQNSRKFILEDLYNILSVPESLKTKFSNFNTKVLEITKREINEKTDLFITKIEREKTGRKITAITIYFEKNPKYKNEFENIEKKYLEQQKSSLNEENIIDNNSPAPKNKNDNFTEFRMSILNKNKSIFYRGNLYSINNNLLAKNGEILDKYSAFAEWEELYKNQNEIEFVEDNTAINITQNDSKLLEALKNKIINKQIIYQTFKKELMKLPNIKICNKVDGYKDNLILQTNDLGHIELLNPVTNEIIELTNIKAEKLKMWLFRNPDIIGNIEEIDYELEEVKSKFLNKVIILKYPNEMRFIYEIKEIVEVNGNDFIVKAINLTKENQEENLKLNKNMKPESKEQLKKRNLIENYIIENSKIEFNELLLLFKNNEDKLNNFIEKLQDEYFELLENEEDEEKIKAFDIKLAKISEWQKREPVFYEKGYLKEFVKFINK